MHAGNYVPILEGFLLSEAELCSGKRKIVKSILDLFFGRKKANGEGRGQAEKGVREYRTPLG
jgi:hypothetical protein